MKKRKKVFFVGVITIFVFFSGLLVRQVLAIQSADCVVRIDFRGIENMFHVPHGGMVYSCIFISKGQW